MISFDPTPDGRPFCRVCGEGVVYEPADHHPLLERVRCPRHLRRNACAIEGCKRSCATSDGYAVTNDTWICSLHWRAACPPRSRRRRAYRAIFREAKRRSGFDDELSDRYWRFWSALVGSARSRSIAGSIDIAEINRIMGW